LAFKKADIYKTKQLTEVATDWRCIPAEEWVREKKARGGKKHKKGFVPCSGDSVHTACANALRMSASRFKATSSSNEQEKPKETAVGACVYMICYVHIFNSAKSPTENSCLVFLIMLIYNSSQAEGGDVATDTKKRSYIATVEVDCDSTGPLTKSEVHAAAKMLKRAVKHTPKENGQEVVYLNSNGGGKHKRFVHVPVSETENPSGRSKRRKNLSIMNTVIMVTCLANCLVQPARVTVNNTLLDFANSRRAISAGVLSRQKLQTGEDDLDYLAYKMNLSLGQVITLVSLGKHRFCFKFGQTIGSHKKGKTERRVDKLYSTEKPDERARD
jgi:hypothetical protein